MLDTRFLRGSDGTGNAPIARVNTARLNGATVLKVDTVNKWPVGAFIATMGMLNANNYLDPALATIVEFRGHVTGSDIIIDSWEPGYTDPAGGTAVNNYVILKQTTGWANLIQDSIAEVQNESILRTAQTLADFVQTGGIWTFTAATLNGAMTALTAYQAGYRNPTPLAAIASRTFTANKDTYVDILRGGTIYAPTFSVVYTEQINGGASPALAANSIRLAKVISGPTAITSIVQTGFIDSLKNPIRPNAPINNLALDASSFGNLNMRGAQPTSGAAYGNGNNDLNGIGCSFTVVCAEPCMMMADVQVGVSTTTDFEFGVILFVDGVFTRTFQPAAAPGFAGNRATVRGGTFVLPLAAGTHLISAGASFSGGSGSYNVQANGASVAALIIGKVTG